MGIILFVAIGSAGTLIAMQICLKILAAQRCPRCDGKMVYQFDVVGSVNEDYRRAEIHECDSCGLRDERNKRDYYS